MLEAEHEFFHRHVTLEADSGGLEQNQSGHQPQDQVVIVGSFCLDLAGLSGQEMLQGPEGMLNPAAPAPCSDQT